MHQNRVRIANVVAVRGDPVGDLANAPPPTLLQPVDTNGLRPTPVGGGYATYGPPPCRGPRIIPLPDVGPAPTLNIPANDDFQGVLHRPWFSWNLRWSFAQPVLYDHYRNDLSRELAFPGVPNRAIQLWIVPSQDTADSYQLSPNPTVGRVLAAILSLLTRPLDERVLYHGHPLMADAFASFDVRRRRRVGERVFLNVDLCQPACADLYFHGLTRLQDGEGGKVRYGIVFGSRPPAQ
ncbi:hypothetical protein C8Q74DRAFT_1372518 [Fomes fomentarius]|nr:hypothetical protein C8Q74DRAFT_1372518 [Fomes fomentarius]